MPLTVKYKNASQMAVMKRVHQTKVRLLGLNEFLPFLHSHSFQIFSTTSHSLTIFYPPAPFWKAGPQQQITTEEWVTP